MWLGGWHMNLKSNLDDSRRLPLHLIPPNPQILSPQLKTLEELPHGNEK